MVCIVGIFGIWSRVTDMWGSWGRGIGMMWGRVVGVVFMINRVVGMMQSFGSWMMRRRRGRG